jgi:hypothetical protein
MAEYNTVSSCILLKHDIENATVEEIGESVNQALYQAVQTTAKELKAQGGGWNIISHELTKLGNNLIVSFLLRH